MSLFRVLSEEEEWAVILGRWVGIRIVGLMLGFGFKSDEKFYIRVLFIGG